LHNLSRSLGCALLAFSETENLILLFVGGEVGALLLFKILRSDFLFSPRLSGFPAYFGSFVERFTVIIIVAFCGCLHFRHPVELGGMGFTLSLVWAQVFPFVALQYFPDGNSDLKGDITVFLAVSLLLWLVGNAILFCTIDVSYLHTFFGTMTASQYSCELFLTTQDDYQRFRAVFTKQAYYTKNIRGEVKDWVAENIDQWKRERPDWFNIEMIPDEYLPKEVLEAEGGAKRRRSSVSLREMVGLREASVGRVHPQALEEMRVEDL